MKIGLKYKYYTPHNVTKYLVLQNIESSRSEEKI